MDEWLPGGTELSGDEALAELARRYLRSHGPASVKDFAWWTGLTLTEAKRAAASVATEFDRASVDGVEYWHDPGVRARSGSRAFLLPPFDEYTIAYADRSAVVDRDRLAAVGYGIAPNLIIDGRLAARWKRTLTRDTVAIELDPSRPLTREEQELVPAAVERYARFLGVRPSIAGID
jgi:hypothetical protein